MADLQTAWNAFQKGDTEQALRIATALAKADPDDAGAWYVLSQSLEGERADLFRRKAFSLDPEVESHFLSRGDETISIPYDDAFGDAALDELAAYEGDTIPTTFLDEAPDEFDDAVPTTFEDLAAELDEDTPTEFYAVPDVRPKVQPLDQELQAEEPAAAPARRRSRGSTGDLIWNTIGLIITGLLILIVLYLLINTLTP